MKLLKITCLVVLTIIVIVAVIIGYVVIAYPDTGPPADIKVERTGTRIERGKYLANHVTICINCHSERDWQTYSAPVVDLTQGQGGEVFGRSMGLPGTFNAPNITPARLGSWTDGEIVRAITTGVSKDGHGLMPVMGYHRFGLMDKEDIYSIIAYIRTLSPIQNEVPESKADFPINLLLRLMPHPAEFKSLPNKSDSIAYGSYLVNAAGCEDCHSKQDKAKLLAGSEYAGGREFRIGAGIVSTTNITTDTGTGIGKWSKDAFVARFKLYADSNYVGQKIGTTGMNTPMPWTMYSGMTRSDLEAIYDFLRTIKPIKNEVVKFKKIQ